MKSEIVIPHDPRFVELWGEDYRNHDEFRKLVEEPVRRGRMMRYVLADLFESHPLPHNPAW